MTTTDRPKHCANCNAAPLKAGPDDDGQWRCVSHSTRPEAVAKRAHQAAAGAAVSKARAELRRQQAELRVKAARAGPGAAAAIKVDLSGRDEVIATLEEITRALLDGRVEAQQGTAASKLAEVALRAHAAPTKRGKDDGEQARAKVVRFQVVGAAAPKPAPPDDDEGDE